MRIISMLVLSILFLVSCSNNSQLEEKQKTEVKKDDPALKAYQDQIQKAKDMEKEILKAAEKQRKIIDGEL
ncbi:MAG: hypothetical protein JKY19_14910 [Alcanivoracaceae bacterium]|nr:hypothetical protein [Alcanivoracaceae bacterium]